MPSGSATICLVRLLEDNGNFSLSYAAIGDSMVIVIRPEQIGGKYALKVVHQSVRKYVSVRAVIPMQLLFAPQRTPKGMSVCYAVCARVLPTQIHKNWACASRT